MGVAVSSLPAACWKCVKGGGKLDFAQKLDKL